MIHLTLSAFLLSLSIIFRRYSYIVGYASGHVAILAAENRLSEAHPHRFRVNKFAGR